jgi:hypothetical protein
MPTPCGVPVQITSPGSRVMKLRDIADDVGAAEDHVGGGGILHALAVEFQPEAQRLRVGDFVARHQPGAERAEAVAALALVPLAAALDLEGALGDVVEAAVAGDVLQRPRFATWRVSRPMTMASSTS